MVGHCRSFFERAAVLEIGGDPGCSGNCDCQASYRCQPRPPAGGSSHKHSPAAVVCAPAYRCRARSCGMARHAPFGTAGNGNGRIASRGRQSRSAPRRTDSCRAALSFRRVLGLAVEHVIGPRLIADHVVGVIGRLVSRRAAGADAGRYCGDRPIDLGVAKKRQRVALAAGAIDRTMRRCEETVVGPAQQQLKGKSNAG